MSPKAIKAAKICAVGAVAIGLAKFGIVAFELPGWAIEMTQEWGPGFLMVGAIFGGVAYYVPRDAAIRFLNAQENQAVATAGLTRAVESLPQKDEMKFDMVLLSQEVTNRKIEKLDAKLDQLQRATEAINAGIS